MIFPSSSYSDTEYHIYIIINGEPTETKTSPKTILLKKIQKIHKSKSMNSDGSVGLAFT